MNQHVHIVLIACLCMCTTCVYTSSTGDCIFPDSDWVNVIAPDGDDGVTYSHIEYSPPILTDSGKFCPWWGCERLYSGTVCSETCTSSNSLKCGEPRQRRTHCIPPLGRRCVACYQDMNEETKDAYSFDPSQINAYHYNLLRDFGSFEHSKIYRTANMMIRNAVRTVSSNPETKDVKWADIMFNKDDVSFLGVGLIDLHNSGIEGLGAMQSNVFAELKTPHSRISVCGFDISHLQNGDVRRIHVRGLVYEFQYRQRVKYDDAIEMEVNLIQNENALMAQVTPEYSSGPIQLPSSAGWKRFQGIIDFGYTFVLEQSLRIGTCIQFDFELALNNAMFFDELYLFANILSVGRWSPTQGNGVITPQDGDILISGLTGISQRAIFSIQDEKNDKLAAIFSARVKGSGTLHIRYFRPNKSIDSIVHIVLTGSGESEDEWTMLNIPVTIHIDSWGDDFHEFQINNYGTDATVLKMNNIYLYVDDRRCPVLQCDDHEKSIFVNGRCELCADYITGDQKCPIGMRQTGCIVDERSIRPNCTQPCTSVYTENEVTANGNWVSGAEACVWKCEAGYWFSKSGRGSGRPMCIQCTSLHSLRCNVGWYAIGCSDNFDTMCVPCDTLNRFDSSVVYTIKGNYASLYEEEKHIQCTRTCAPQQFQYAVRSDDNTPMCFPCTSSICGAENDGIFSPRMLDGLQYTSKCTATSDSNCQLCESSDTSVIFTTNAGAIGEWCKYRCSAGFTKCGTCNWDQAIAILIQPNKRRIEFNQTLMVRFSGTATLNSAKFGTEFSIRVYVSAELNGNVHKWNPRGDTGTIVRLTPVVPPPALTIMQMSANNNDIQGYTKITNAPGQDFDVTIEARDFINTAEFTVWNAQHVAEGVSLFLVYELSDISIHMVNLTNFAVHTVDSKDGCCAERFLNDTEPVDPTSLKRCLPCEKAQGIDGPLPENANWRDPDDCSWDCNPLFEIIPGGSASVCESCSDPECDTGKYWTGCGICQDCDQAPENSFFTGPGTTRYDGASCPIQCDTSFFLLDVFNATSVCKKCTELSTLDCSNVTKKKGLFFERTCSSTLDATCINCRICTPGFNTTTQCSKRSDGVCTQCDDDIIRMPDLTIDGGAQWRRSKSDEGDCQWKCREGLQYNPGANTCFVCNSETCGIGFFPVSCTKENNYQGCAKCISPQNSVVVSTGIMELNSSCMWECPHNFFYNGTNNQCVLQPIVEVQKIDIPTDVYCEGTLCGWGYFFDTTFNVSPCSAMCRACPEIRNTDKARVVYARKSSCEWVCIWPYLLDNGNCLLLD